MSASKRLLLDVLLLLAILLAYKPAATGITVHEWLSLAFSGAALFHVVVNWDWTVWAVRRLFRRLRGTARLNFIVDALLFLATVTVTLSGLMVSRVVMRALGLEFAPEDVWHTVHSVSADTTLALAIVHLALHWKWFARALRSRVARRRAATSRPHAA